METKNVWPTYDKKALKSLEKLSSGYIDFLSNGKTERECVDQIVESAHAAGYKDLTDYIMKGKALKPGDKIIAVNMKKSVAMFQIGKEPFERGMNILGAHIDSPRMDVKQNPLYEDKEIVYLDTHYYGGIKKYQFVTLPLAIHGVIVKENGEVCNVNVGEDPDDPVFCVSDILIHLAGEQMEKKASKAIEGDNLDVIIGNKPLAGEEKNAVKKNILNILKDKYGIEEEDFISAELEIVPAGPAREMGFDRSMILSHGQDDRVCAYSSLIAMLDTPVREKTSCCLLVDKEEIGSVGATGMQSKFFENTVAELINLNGNYSEISLKRTLANSRMLSSDVSAGFDPLYKDRFEGKNAAYLGHGIVFNKFTGARGKSGSNDANAEYMAAIRKIMDDNNVHFQTAELGKVDVGGGGTIAYILSLYGMEVIDAGVPVLSMHSPWEVTSKADLYEAYKGYIAFLKDA
ncbi:MAG: aminopeptidase [Lachnospiraceae bacterium]|jgi:aspartyl aminopeptidase|nr:aminopeptidase [Lachnospiraceae bacterium]MEE3460800.1 aminopeptidase [Lachnospiraceae bacterium]